MIISSFVWIKHQNRRTDRSAVTIIAVRIASNEDEQCEHAIGSIA